MPRLPADRAETLPDCGRTWLPGASGAAPRVLVAQLGARRHYAVPTALWRAGLLDRLVTDFCADTGPWPAVRSVVASAARPAGLRRLLQRSAGEIPPSRIVSLSSLAFDPRLRRRNGEAATDFWARRNAAFGAAVVKAGFGAADCVYAFNGAALEVFRAAKAQGLRTILDQTAAPWRWNAALLAAEVARWPGWEDEPAERDASGLLSDREEAEWQLADRVIAGSSFARQALADSGGPAGRTSILAYPAPGLHPHPGGSGSRPAAFSSARRLRALFVGTLQLRKGVQYLYEAAGLLKDEPVEFRAVGPSLLSAEATALLTERLTLTGGVPRGEVARHYAWADVLVLPTLSEGSANVCYEAIAAGLPVIATPNAGSALQDNVSGLIVPERSADAIAAALASLIREPQRLPALAADAVAAAGANPLECYAAGLAGAVRSAAPASVTAAA